jgi:rubrerythrin
MKKVYETIEVELSDKIIEGLCDYALEAIKNDRDALIDYAAGKILSEIVNNPGEFERIIKKYREDNPHLICSECDYLMDEENGEMVCPNCRHTPDNE